jgi:hypothetical protein
MILTLKFLFLTYMDVSFLKSKLTQEDMDEGHGYTSFQNFACCPIALGWPNINIRTMEKTNVW